MSALPVMFAAGKSLASPSVEWASLSPLLVLVGGAIGLLLVGGLVPRKLSSTIGLIVAVSSGLGSIVASVLLWRDLPESGARTAVVGAYSVDFFTLFVCVVIAVALIAAAFVTDGYLRREDLIGPEAYILYLVSAAGAFVMVSAADLIVLFLGLEVMSIAAYVLAGLHRRRIRSGEAALKYFVLGGFSSAFLLYGIALIYGATGSTSMIKIANFLTSVHLVDDGLLLAGVALLLVGFGFKVAAVPFHSWTPDVYQGSPSPVVSFMASAIKTAAFAGLLRVLLLCFATTKLDIQPVLYALAIGSLLVGATMAVTQTDVKRMMAYSSINHAGFMLVAVATQSVSGSSAVLFYLAAYTVMVCGSFAVITALGRRGDAAHELDSYEGLARREPLLAGALTLFLLAQAGTPLTAGFLAKFYVIEAAVNAGSFWLGIVAMLSAVISAYLYLRIILTMYNRADESDEVPGPRLAVPFATKAVIVVTAAATLLFGFFPNPLSEVAHDARPELVEP